MLPRRFAPRQFTHALLGAALASLGACGGENKATPPGPDASAAPSAAPPVPLVIPKAGTLPAAFPAVTAPADNASSDAKVALGHQLFFDKRLSVDGSRSCYSCHLNEDGNGGHDPIAIGAGEKKLTRHSPVIWNVAYYPSFYWDGRSPSLEEQGKAAWAGGNMGVGKENLEKKAGEIAKVPGYKKQFDAVFGKDGVTPDTIMKAVSAYERTLLCRETAYDKYATGDASALDETQQKGLGLFLGKGQCVLCHAPPFFAAGMGAPQAVFHNVGIGTNKPEPDLGRQAATKSESDFGAFKVPSLRNISKSAPYFHDGSVASLEEAVRLMAKGGVANKNLSPLMKDRNLADDEVRAIVAFLGALDCKQKLEEPKLPLVVPLASARDAEFP
ncbi:MAG: c-type cytochrome [Polyangiaceae bacterium]|nr:c-type cytochrome [Polyangiaceae bacterium]